MIECIIIEDQAPAQRVIEKYLESTPSLSLKAVFSDPLEALDYLQTHSVDLIFLDIHLPKISGIDFLQILPVPPKVIFTTAFEEYALKGYEFNVVDYLLKPFSLNRFLKAVAKLNSAMEEGRPRVQQAVPANESVFVKSGHEYIAVQLSSILYIKGEGDYTAIFTGAKKYLISFALKQWEQKFSNHHFYRIHRSYLINIKQISRVTGNEVEVSDGTVLPLGRNFKEAFLKRLGL